MGRTYDWEFPLPRTHTGMLQGNAVFGTMIWGEGNVLKITIGRADCWDHRGGLKWTETQSYQNIRRRLENNDERGLRKLFEDTSAAAGIPRRPSVLPVGRFEIVFEPDVTLLTGTLDVDSGLICIQLKQGAAEHRLQSALDMHAPVSAVRLSEGLNVVEIRRVPSWNYVGEQLAAISFVPPQLFEGRGTSGWVQPLPADPPLCVLCRRTAANELLFSAAFGDDAQDDRAGAEKAVSDAESFARIERRSQAWWETYWKSIAKVNIPNRKLQFLYDYGMYKFGGLTNPAGVAATLQGPWIEEYQMPPWSSDYHFNINVQMCYWPAFHGNAVGHLRPLFDLIATWEPELRHNARVFLGIDDGLMLPHAVDDRCRCMGGFWTGSIDHGCTAWVAQMMYRYYRYSMDAEFLRRQAFPFMVGAMRVYEEMLERDGGLFVLPVSVSPEYRGASMNAWGRNASFQLACIHRLCEDLLEAAELLGVPSRPIWSEISSKLPKASIVTGRNGEKTIGLWDGTPLEESHRHHSHLGGIAPFDILDFDDDEWRKVILNSITEWIYRGPGLWSGWCVPWASMIHTRLGNGDAAELWLEIWQKLFTNQGHGTLHDVDFPGFSLMGKGATCSASTRGEIMQIEAGMSCVAAIHEMLLHTRRGENFLFQGVPRSWKTAAFENILTDGAFEVTASYAHGKTVVVTVRSLAGGEFRLRNPWASAHVRRCDAPAECLSARTLRIAMRKGESITLAAGGGGIQSCGVSQ